MSTIESISKAIEDLKKSVKYEFPMWAFGRALAQAIGHGEVVLKIDNYAVKDVDIRISSRMRDTSTTAAATTPPPPRVT